MHGNNIATNCIHVQRPLCAKSGPQLRPQIRTTRPPSLQFNVDRGDQNEMKKQIVFSDALQHWVGGKGEQDVRVACVKHFWLPIGFFTQKLCSRFVAILFPPTVGRSAGWFGRLVVGWSVSRSSRTGVSRYVCVSLCAYVYVGACQSAFSFYTVMYGISICLQRLACLSSPLVPLPVLWGFSHMISLIFQNGHLHTKVIVLRDVAIMQTPFFMLLTFVSSQFVKSPIQSWRTYEGCSVCTPCRTMSLVPFPLLPFSCLRLPSPPSCSLLVLRSFPSFPSRVSWGLITMRFRLSIL